MRLMGFGTLVACTSYSMFKQTHLVRAFVANRLTMLGCTGSGGGKAKGATLARLGGGKDANAVLIGCNGGVTYELKDPAKYVDPATGTIQIRFVNSRQDAVGMSFSIVIQGDVE